MTNIINKIAEAIDDLPFFPLMEAKEDHLKEFARRLAGLKELAVWPELDKYDVDDEVEQAKLLQLDVKKYAQALKKFIDDYPQEEFERNLVGYVRINDPGFTDEDAEGLIEYVSSLNGDLDRTRDLYNHLEDIIDDPENNHLSLNPFEEAQWALSGALEHTGISYMEPDKELEAEPEFAEPEEEKPREPATIAHNIQHGRTEYEAPESTGDSEFDSDDVAQTAFVDLPEKDKMTPADYEVYQKLQTAKKGEHRSAEIPRELFLDPKKAFGDPADMSPEQRKAYAEKVKAHAEKVRELSKQDPRTYTRGEAEKALTKGVHGVTEQEYSEERRTHWGEIQDGLREAASQKNFTKLIAALRDARMGHVAKFLAEVQKVKAKSHLASRKARTAGNKALANWYYLEELLNDEYLSAYEVDKETANEIAEILIDTGVQDELESLYSEVKQEGYSLYYHPSHPFRVPQSTISNTTLEKRKDDYVDLIGEYNRLASQARKVNKGKENYPELSNVWDPGTGPSAEALESKLQELRMAENDLVYISDNIISVYNKIVNVIGDALVRNWIGTGDPQTGDYGTDGELYQIFSDYWPDSYAEYEDVGLRQQEHARVRQLAADPYSQTYTIYYFLPRDEGGKATYYDEESTLDADYFTMPEGSSHQKEQVTDDRQVELLNSDDPGALFVTEPYKPTIVYLKGADGKYLLDELGQPAAAVLPHSKKLPKEISSFAPAQLKVVFRDSGRGKDIQYGRQAGKPEQSERPQRKVYFTAQSIVRDGRATIKAPVRRYRADGEAANINDVVDSTQGDSSLSHRNILSNLGYNPNEIVHVIVAADDGIKEIDGMKQKPQALTRTALAKSGIVDLVEAGKADFVDIFPVGVLDQETGRRISYEEPVIYAISSFPEYGEEDDGPPTEKYVERLSYEKYLKILSQQKKLFDLVADPQYKIEALTPDKKYLYYLRLPQKRDGSPYSREEILNREYDPVDNNGSKIEMVPYVDKSGEENFYDKTDISSASDLIDAIRYNYNEEKLIYQSTGAGLQPWILYDSSKDNGESRIPEDAVKLRLPPSPPSFIRAFGNKSRASMGLQILDCGWEGPYFVVREFPWAVRNFDWNAPTEDIARVLNIKNLDAVEYLKTTIEDYEDLNVDSLAAIIGKSGIPNRVARKRALELLTKINTNSNWTLRTMKNVPFADAIRMAKDMWIGHYHPDKLKSKKGDVQFFEDPNNEVFSISAGDEEKASYVRKRMEKEKSATCMNTVKRDGIEQHCGLSPAINDKHPKQVAEVSTKGGKTQWEMINSAEAEVLNDLADYEQGFDVDIQPEKIRGGETLTGVDALKARARRLRARGDQLVGAHSAVCDRCWAMDFEIIPDRLVRDMLDGLERVYNASERYLVKTVNARDEVKSKIKDAIVYKMLYPYIKKYWTKSGPIGRIIDYVDKGTKLSSKYKDSITRPLKRSYERIVEGLMHLITFIEVDALEPETDRHFFSLAVLQLMHKIKNMWMWASGTRYAQYDKVDPNGSLERENSIKTFSSIDRPDVRNANALSAALRNVDPDWRGKWQGASELQFESTHNKHTPIGEYCRVAIDGFVGEEAEFNGLLGYLIEEDKDGMCLVHLDPNGVLSESMIKTYPGELKILWDNREVSEEEEYSEFLKELEIQENQNQRIIDIIGDNTSEYLFR